MRGIGFEPTQGLTHRISPHLILSVANLSVAKLYTVAAFLPIWSLVSTRIDQVPGSFVLTTLAPPHQKKSTKIPYKPSCYFKTTILVMPLRFFSRIPLLSSLSSILVILTFEYAVSLMRSL